MGKDGRPTLEKSLVAALNAGKMEVFRKALAAGADPNANPGSPIRPLHIAAAHENPEAVRLLLEAGANPMRMDKWGRLAAYYSITRSDTTSALLQIDAAPQLAVAQMKNGYGLLETAVKQRLYEVAKRLLAYGADPDGYADALERRPLRIAHSAGDTEMVELLRRHGADPGKAGLFQYRRRTIPSPYPR